MTVKGSGKGNLAKGFKGKEKALAKDPPQPAAKTEEELLGEALTKARKMRDLTASCISNFEEALAGVKKSKFW